MVGELGDPTVRLADGSTGVVADGAFVSPLLLRFADARTPAVHTVEAFGPVASILSYGSPPRRPNWSRSAADRS